MGKRRVPFMGKPFVKGTNIKPQKHEIDGHKLDSKAELIRYGQLKLMVRAGEIRELEVHPKYPMVVPGLTTGKQTKIGRGYFKPDFRYKKFIDTEWRPVIEDAKGPFDNPVSDLRRRICEAVNEITINVVSVRD